MGYKKIFNRTTLQLIIPLSTMTKAEYKSTYGIDLDSIDFEKVTLLQEDGDENKYYVDEIKTTENGVDIYAGGKILSIASSVSVVENAYSVSNSKPLYIHPISIFKNTGDTQFLLSLLIFNNSPTKFDLTSLRAYIDALYEIVGDVITINATGYYKNASKEITSCSYIFKASSSDNYGIQGGAYDALEYVSITGSWDTLFSGDTFLRDGVNKLN